MKRFIPSSASSLLSALFLVAMLILAGCSADSITGPVLAPETIQASGDDHNNKKGGDDHNNDDQGDDNDDQ